MTLTTAKIEFSQDDLSDTTPTWTDVTTYVKEVQWFSGKSSDLDPPQQGGAVIVLNNADRRFEPDYSAGAYSPNIKPLRRFRLTMTADGTAHTQGIYYVSSWGVGYPARTSYSEVTVSCSDGVGILSLDTLPTLTPPSAATYQDVVMADNPIAYYPCDDITGRTLTAATGNEGRYIGSISMGQPNPVAGDANPAVLFGVTTGYARAAAPETTTWKDSNQASGECVVTRAATGTRTFISGPWRTASSAVIFELDDAGASIITQTSSSVISWAAPIGSETAHLAFTYDGSVLRIYKNGVFVTSGVAGDAPATPDASEFLYIGGAINHGASASNDDVIGHAAFYDYALNATQIAAHAAAVNLGYAEQTTGDRVADLATNALWSTAGITGGQTISVAPRMQNGQPKLSEITLVAQAEQPYGLFYFDDSGNPAYQGIDYDPTSAATFSDSASDIQYDGINLTYDDDLYNNVTIAREGGEAQTREDATSEAAYMTRGYNQTGLILATDDDADLVAAGVFDAFVNPRIRVSSISLNGGTQTARNQILTREIGDTIRVKRRTDTAEAIDVITRIIGKQKRIAPDGVIHCTWQLSRGIDASDAHWHLGVTGFSELNTTTILA